jgi:hypothetical protein
VCSFESLVNRVKLQAASTMINIGSESLVEMLRIVLCLHRYKAVSLLRPPDALPSWLFNRLVE